MIHATHYRSAEAFVTRDGSLIRELMHPARHGNTQLSLAEATVPAGTTTLLHRHRRTEEIYHVTAGAGHMTLGTDQFAIAPGDTVCIPPGTPHCVANTGDTDLVILCACAPAYSHDDTELL
jgi:mannose-6-phosphate isomerase-like protein (cupin superfamily)